MKLQNYLRKPTAETDLDDLASFQDTALGAAIRKAVNTRIREVRGEIDANPVLVTAGDVRPSIPYRLGEIEGLNWLLDFLAEARSARGMQPKEETENS